MTNNQSELMCASKRYCTHNGDKLLVQDNNSFYCGTCNFNVHEPECAHPLSIRQDVENQKIFQCMTCYQKMPLLNNMNKCSKKGCKEVSSLPEKLPCFHNGKGKHIDAFVHAGCYKILLDKYGY